MTTLYIALASIIWVSIVSLIAAIIAMCFCVYELRKLVGQVRGLIKKVSSKETQLEIEDPDSSATGTKVMVQDGWDENAPLRD